MEEPHRGCRAGIDLDGRAGTSRWRNWLFLFAVFPSVGWRIEAGGPIGRVLGVPQNADNRGFGDACRRIERGSCEGCRDEAAVIEGGPREDAVDQSGRVEDRTGEG